MVWALELSENLHQPRWKVQGTVMYNVMYFCMSVYSTCVCSQVIIITSITLYICCIIIPSVITGPRRLIDIESVDTASRVLSRRGRFDTDPDNQCSFPSSIDSNYYGKLVLPPGPLHVHVLMARNLVTLPCTRGPYWDVGLNPNNCISNLDSSSVFTICACM